MINFTEEFIGREELRVNQQVLRAQNKGLIATLTIEEWLNILSLFGGMCAYCQEQPFDALDHLIPLASGHGTTAENCAPACTVCNSRKGRRTLPLQEGMTLMEKIECVRLHLFSLDVGARQQIASSDPIQTMHFQPARPCVLGCGNVATVAIVKSGPRAYQPLTMMPVCRSCVTGLFYSYEQSSVIPLSPMAKLPSTEIESTISSSESVSKPSKELIDTTELEQATELECATANLERAVQAYKKGFTSIDRLAASLNVSPWAARRLMSEMKVKGLI